MKCDICGNRIEKTFLDKIMGSYFGKGKKRKVVCSECQRKFSKEELLEKLPS